MIVLKYDASEAGNLGLIDEIINSIVHKTHKDIQIRKSDFYFNAPIDTKLYGSAEWHSENYGASVFIFHFDTTYVSLENHFLEGVEENKDEYKVLLNEKIKIDGFEGLKIKTDKKENGNFDLISILFGDEQNAISMTFKYKELSLIHI